VRDLWRMIIKNQFKNLR